MYNKNYYTLMLSVLLACLLFSEIVSAQIERETRAVWVATNFRLDWPPPTFDQQKQKQALIKIFDQIEKQNLNTIYFQVRFNGTVLFNSTFEPWSYYLTGIVDGEPDYDPLQFAINEAHNRGLEIHAWFNMLKCFDGTESVVFEHPEHVMNKHINWVHKVEIDDKTTYWLEPGLPEVQTYLANVVADVADKYDLDGIHLDYIRYPSRPIDDSFAYASYGNGQKLDQWRRDNITAIVRKIKEQVDEINPYIKVGAAPIGIYTNKPNATGMQAYSEIYQESRSWLRDGLVDYLAPQIYWNFQDNPKFNLVVDDWVKEAYGRNIVVGIASYKDDVKRETPTMIKYSRKAGAKGVSFFRYKFIENDSHYFTTKALPSAMPWKPKLFPIAPENLTATISGEEQNRIELSWNLSEMQKNRYDVKYYALFSRSTNNDVAASSELFKIIPASISRLSFSLNKASKLNYYYSVKSLDRYWNESPTTSEIKSINIPSLQSLYSQSEYNKQPILIGQSGDKYIIISSNKKNKLKVAGKVNSFNELLLSKDLKEGVNILALNKNLSKYQSLILTFADSEREVRLNLN